MSQQISATFRDVQKDFTILQLKTNSNFLIILILPHVFHIAEYKMRWLDLSYEFFFLYLPGFILN